MKLRKQAHSVYFCEYHIVFIPKYRYKILVKGVSIYLEIKLDEVRKYYPEIIYLERSVQIDHVHLLLGFPPKCSISQIVGIIKQNTSKALRDKFDFIKERYPNTSSIWSPGYFVSTVGVNESVIKKYIQNQEKEDLGQSLIEFPEKPRA